MAFAKKEGRVLYVLALVRTGREFYSDGENALRRLAERCGLPAGTTLQITSEMLEVDESTSFGPSNAFLGIECFWKEV